MEIKYDKETDSKYVQIKKGIVDSTKEETNWFFLDCDKNGEVLGVEILEASEHFVNLITVNNNLIGFSLGEERLSVEALQKKMISSKAVHQPSQSSLAEVQLVS